MQEIIFTDLDGTLLDHNTYSFAKAKPALSLVKKRKIPLVICTSKTRLEIELWRKKLKNSHPFISEDGGAIFIPKKYFNFKFDYDRKLSKYYVIELGLPYKKLRAELNKLKKKYDLYGFGDLSAKKLMKETKL